jgi:hypothetical protein
LREIGHARANITAHQVWVALLEIGGRRHRTCEHAIAKAGRVSLDLLLDSR